MQQIFIPIYPNVPHIQKQRQKMNKFVQTIEKKANQQNQDRICYDFIQSLNGYTFTVLDGHGSKQCADFVHKKINGFINRRFQHNQKLNLPINQLVEKSLNQAFQDVQNQWYKVYKKHQYQHEFRRSGACCLTSVVLENSIHIANAGDCQGAILGQHQPIKTNKRLNASEPQQKKRLKRLFPTQKDIIVERQTPTKTCGYVKGLLQPTKAIGDFELKDQKQNIDVKNFNGPYIDYKPTFTHFNLGKDSQYLVLGTDGLWDQLNIEEIDNVAKTKDGGLAKALYKACMKHIKSRSHLTEQQLQKAPLRRMYHDDISIIVVDLKRLIKHLHKMK